MKLGESTRMRLINRNLKELWNFDKHSFLPDSLLSDNGITQATNLHLLINVFRYVKILVAPSRKTIQTAVYIL